MCALRVSCGRRSAIEAAWQRLDYALIVALIAVPITQIMASAGQLAGLLHDVGAYLTGVPAVGPDP